MEKVFISYGSKNRQTAEDLCAFLEGHGIPCWIAPRDISSGTYAGEITRAIKAADIMVAVFSKFSCSEHVKTEVNLAFTYNKLILPYCLDETPFDDDLEYWLASKQRIVSSGVIPDDFQRIWRIVREHRGENSTAAASAPKLPEQPRRRSLLLPLVCVGALLAGAFLFFAREGRTTIVDDPGTPVDTTAVESLVADASTSTTPDVPVVKPAVVSNNRAEVKDPYTDTFSGKITNGYPDGFGTFTFKKARRIDIHDAEERMAEPGDYIVGSWTKGHLNYGEWYGNDGVKKAYIQLGEHPDVEKDQLLGKCVKP